MIGRGQSPSDAWMPGAHSDQCHGLLHSQFMAMTQHNGATHLLAVLHGEVADVPAEV